MSDSSLHVARPLQQTVATRLVLALSLVFGSGQSVAPARATSLTGQRPQQEGVIAAPTPKTETSANIEIVASTSTPILPGEDQSTDPADVPASQPLPEATSAPPLDPPPPPVLQRPVAPPREPLVIPPPPPAEEPPPVVVLPTPTPIVDNFLLSDLPSPTDLEERKDHKKGEMRQYGKGKVQVKLPANTAADEVTFKVKETKRLLKGESGQFLVFDIKAMDKRNKKAVVAFDAPVEITTMLTGFVSNAAQLPDNKRVYVAYFNEQSKAWAELPEADVDRGSTLLRFRTKHFSTYGLGITGSSPNAWTPAFSDASIDRFSGGFSWGYNFPLPTGQGGKTPPGLALSYSSRSVDGLTTYGQPDGVGYGWNIDSGEIMWSGVRVSLEYGNMRLVWNPRLTLALNGKTYKLSPQGDPLYPSDPFSRTGTWQYQNHFNTVFKAESDDYLRTRWLDQSGGQNGYFEVTAKDGTRYVFGNSEDSRVVLRGAYWGSIWSPPNNGNNNGTRQTVRWRLKQVIYPTGAGSVNYTYEKQNYAEQCVLFTGYTCTTPNYIDEATERASYIKQIDYPGARVVFNWDRRWNGNGPDDGRYQQAWDKNDSSWAMFWQTDALQSVEVQRHKQDGNYGLIQKWLLTYTSVSVEASSNTYKNLRVLQKIEPIGADGVTRLPVTLFGHTVVNNKDAGGNTSWDNWWFPYPRVKSIHNGYGAVISATYETCDNGWWHTHNFRVKEQTVNDGIGGGNKTVFSYPPTNVTTDTERLYANDQYSPTWPSQFPEWGRACGVSNRPEAPIYRQTGGSFVGYRTVTTTVQSVDGATTLRRGRDSFVLLPGGITDTTLPSWLARGRPLQTVVLPATGSTVLSQQDYSYTASATGDTAHFIRLDWQTRLQDGMTTKVEYAYDGYGNPKAVVEHGNTAVTGDERTTLTGYYPNATAWFVGLPAWSRAYAGAHMQSNGDAVYTNPTGWATETRYTYDGNVDYTGQPTAGLLRKTSRGDPYTSPFYFPAFAEETLSYDGFGNVTDYADPRTNHTLITYTNGIYATASSNALGHRTEARYACIGASACPTGQPIGSLLAVRDISNNVEVAYTYDPFGRLKTVVRPGDTITHATQFFNYGDIGQTSIVPPLVIQASQREVSGCGGCTHPTLTFYDGMGRVIQAKSETVNGTQQVEVNTLYNALGQKLAESIPVYQNFASFAPPEFYAYHPPANNYWTNASTLKTSYQYDLLGRTTVITGVDGVTTTTAYSGFAVVMRDGIGHLKISESDGLGRLTRVKEISGTFGAPTFAVTPYAGWDKDARGKRECSYVALHSPKSI